MKCLVVGSKGQLGWELERQGARSGFEITGVDLPEFDITDPDGIKQTLEAVGAAMVVNASAYTAVDRAESESRLAFEVNATGPGYLAIACRHQGIPLFHISTDYVFNGEKSGPYREDDPVCPMGVYGQSKAAGEAEVKNSLSEHIIIRTAWLYGVHGHNFVKTMLRLAKEKQELSVVSDQQGCPTYAADLAAAVLEIAGQFGHGRSIKWGTYHFTGEGATSWHGFAEAIFGFAQSYTKLAVTKVIPIPTEAYPTPAPRPKNSVLDCSLIKKNFAIRPRRWDLSLGEMIQALYTGVRA